MRNFIKKLEVFRIDLEKFGGNLGKIWGKFGKDLGQIWDKFGGNLGKIWGKFWGNFRKTYLNLHD